MDNFNVIYKILKHLEVSLDCEYTDCDAISHERLNITHARWEQLLIMLQDDGYIRGIVCSQTMSDDKRHIAEPIHPIITLRGIGYLSKNSTMQKVVRTLK